MEQLDIEDFIEEQKSQKAAQSRSEVALTDLPHPFLKRIASITFGENDPTEEQLNQVRQVLTCLAHFEWPGDVKAIVKHDIFTQALVTRAFDYICKPIPAGSPITPPALRQGVILTAPRS